MLDRFSVKNITGHPASTFTGLLISAGVAGVQAWANSGAPLTVEGAVAVAAPAVVLALLGRKPS